MSSGSGKRPLKVGLVLQHWTNGRGVAPTWEQMKERALLAEQLGFDSLWLVDHLQFSRKESGLSQGAGQTARPDQTERVDWVGLWECWSTISALAAITSRVQLGTIVTCTAFRNPALMAKIAETAHEISGGRVILGIGAGDHEGEFDSFGYQWDRKVAQFEEALQIIVPLLKEGYVDFQGEFYSANDLMLQPRGPGKTGPEILIGARIGGPRMLRLCTQYADMHNFWRAYGRSRPDVVPPMREAVDQACEKYGRDPSTLGRTLTVGAALLGRKLGKAETLSGSPEENAELIRGFAAEGIEHLQIYLHPNNVEGITELARALEVLDAG
jgi:alkanesulfonate monooxygenase SsuD/methylene tetrahydromethanopterin reductase-like flavin-dependent oxidoreductase (luciferase family)